jgi:hypothetical protein
MAYSIQGIQQISLPLADWSFFPLQFQPTGTIGNAPTNGSGSPAYATSSSFNWTITGAALTTDYGSTGDPNSGVELALTCTVGTVNGLNAPGGVSGRLIAPPAGTIILPMAINVQCVRFEVFGLHWDTTPTGTQCTRDSGVTFTQGGYGQGNIYDTTQTGNGGGNMGWGVVMHTATGQLQYIAKQVNGTGGVGLSTATDIGAPVNGFANPFYLDMRWYMPTVSTPASIDIFIDNVQKTSLLSTNQSSWTAGTLLPALNVGGSAKALGFVPGIANNSPTGNTANPVMHFTGARLRIGSIPAVTLENQR